jgi:hypothetical protein
MISTYFYVGFTWSKIRCVLLSCLLVYIMNSWKRVLEQQLIAVQPVKKLSVVYGIKTFSTLFIRVVTKPSREPARLIHSMIWWYDVQSLIVTVWLTLFSYRVFRGLTFYPNGKNSLVKCVTVWLTPFSYRVFRALAFYPKGKTVNLNVIVIGW